MATAKAAPAARPTKPTKSTPMGELKEYISNPFALIVPSIRAYMVNISTIILAILLSVGVFLLLAILTILLVIFGLKAGGAGFWSLVAVAGIVDLVVAILLAPLGPVILYTSVKNQQITLGAALDRSVKLAPRFFGISALTVLAVLGGLVLLIVPAFIFGAWFSLSIYAALDEDTGVIDSMKRSKALVKEHVWETWGLQSLVGTILGILMAASQPVRYLQLKELKASGTEKPPIHWANFAAILLALVLNSVTRFDAVPNSHNSTTNSIDSNSYYSY